jgi:hypothetical protein
MRSSCWLRGPWAAWLSGGPRREFGPILDGPARFNYRSVASKAENPEGFAPTQVSRRQQRRARYLLKPAEGAWSNSVRVEEARQGGPSERLHRSASRQDDSRCR